MSSYMYYIYLAICVYIYIYRYVSILQPLVLVLSNITMNTVGNHSTIGTDYNSSFLSNWRCIRLINVNKSKLHNE